MKHAHTQSQGVRGKQTQRAKFSHMHIMYIYIHGSMYRGKDSIFSTEKVFQTKHDSLLHLTS